MSVRKKLERLLIAGEIDDVLKSMTVIADQMGDNTLMNDVVHLADRRQQAQLKKQNGTLDPAAFEKENRQISQALMLLVVELPD